MYFISGQCGVGTFFLQTFDGITLEKPVNGFKLKLYEGRCPQLMITSGIVLLEFCEESGESSRTMQGRTTQVARIDDKAGIKATPLSLIPDKGLIKMEEHLPNNGLPASPINSGHLEEALHDFMPSYVEALSLSSLVPVCSCYSLPNLHSFSSELPPFPPPPSYVTSNYIF